MSTQNSVVAVYSTHTQADQAVKELQRSGIDMHKLSIVGKGYHTDEHVVGYYNAGDRMKYWGRLGAFWGGFWGLLFGSAFQDSGSRSNLSRRPRGRVGRGSDGKCGGRGRSERTRGRTL